MSAEKTNCRVEIINFFQIKKKKLSSFFKSDHKKPQGKQWKQKEEKWIRNVGKIQDPTNGAGNEDEQ